MIYISNIDGRTKTEWNTSDGSNIMLLPKQVEIYFDITRLNASTINEGICKTDLAKMFE